MFPIGTLTSLLILARIAAPAAITCPSSSELSVTVPPSIQSPSNTYYKSLANVHDALTHCPNITSLNLRIGEIGCVGEPDRWSLPLDPAGTSRYLPVLDTLSLEKYHFYDTDGDYLRPLRGWAHLSTWILSGDAFGWVKWRLEWRTPESLESKRPTLPRDVLRDLRNLAPNLQSLIIDLNRNSTWPWEDLRALSLGLPAGLTNLTLYLEITSECRRQQGPLEPIRCVDMCGPTEQLASPLLTATSALQVARFIRHYAKSPLTSINFFAGDWTRPWDGPINVPTWLDGRRAWIACGTEGGEGEELRCSGKDTALNEHEIELFRVLCIRTSADLLGDITDAHPQDFVE